MCGTGDSIFTQSAPGKRQKTAAERKAQKARKQAELADADPNQPWALEVSPMSPATTGCSKAASYTHLRCASKCCRVVCSTLGSVHKENRPWHLVISSSKHTCHQGDRDFSTMHRPAGRLVPGDFDFLSSGRSIKSDVISARSSSMLAACFQNY